MLMLQTGFNMIIAQIIAILTKKTASILTVVFLPLRTTTSIGLILFKEH